MMLKQMVILVLVNVAVFCACAEMLALTVYYYEHGWLFYANPYRQTIEVVPDAAQGQAFTDIGLSPYFGPIHRAGSRSISRRRCVKRPRRRRAWWPTTSVLPRLMTTRSTERGTTSSSSASSADRSAALFCLWV